MSTSGQIGSTALTIAGVAVGALVLIRLLPDLIPTASSVAQGRGVPINNLTFPYLESQQSQNPDSAQFLAGLYNMQHGANYDGSALTPGERADVTTQYNSGLDSASIPYQDASALPSSDYATQGAMSAGYSDPTTGASLSLDTSADFPDADYPTFSSEVNYNSDVQDGELYGS